MKASNLENLYKEVSIVFLKLYDTRSSVKEKISVTKKALKQAEINYDTDLIRDLTQTLSAAELNLKNINNDIENHKREVNGGVAGNDLVQQILKANTLDFKNNNSNSQVQSLLQRAEMLSKELDTVKAELENVRVKEKRKRYNLNLAFKPFLPDTKDVPETYHHFQLLNDRKR